MRVTKNLAVAIAFLFAVLFPACAQAATAWDFTQTWDSGYSYMQTIPSSGSPWSSTGGYTSSYGAHIYQYSYYNSPYSLHIGTTSDYSTSFYDFYLTYKFSSATTGPGTLSCWYYCVYTTLEFQTSTNGTTWASTPVLPNRDYLYGYTRTYSIPVGTLYLRWKSNSYAYVSYGTHIDNIVFTMQSIWVADITGYNKTTPNAGILNLTASAGSLSGLVSSVTFEYMRSSVGVWTLAGTDSTSSDGWTCSIDTTSFSDFIFQVRARSYYSSYGYSSYFTVTMDVQNITVETITFDKNPIGGLVDVAIKPKLPTGTRYFPTNPWVWANYSYSIWYTYIELLDKDNPIPFGGTVTGVNTNFYTYYSPSSFKVKFWKSNGGNSYTLQASSSTINVSTSGPKDYALSEAALTNLPAGLNLGMYCYQIVIYGSGGAPYNGNGPDRAIYYYGNSEISSGTFTSWSGPVTYICIPIRAIFNASGTAATSAKLRYRVGTTGTPVAMPDATLGSDGLLHCSWPSWLADGTNIYIDVSFYNGAQGGWNVTGPHTVVNKITLRFQTNVGGTTPGAGIVTVNGTDYPSGTSLTFTYAETIQVSVPLYQFDTNGKRWRWDSWNTGKNMSDTLQPSAGMNTTVAADYVRQYSFIVDSVRPTMKNLPDGWYDPGTDIVCSATKLSVSVPNQERFECSGYEIVAKNERSTSLDLSFKLDRDVVVHWLWTAQHYFQSLNTLSSGSGSQPGWYNDGAHISYMVAQTLPNGNRSRALCLGHNNNGVYYPDIYSLSFDILVATTIEWVWVQQFEFLPVTNAGTISPMQDWYDEGTEIEVVSTPPVSDDRARYAFLEWKGTGAGSYKRVGGEPVCTITVNSPITETAVWKIEYYLVLSSPNGSFSPNNSGWYFPNTEVTVSAVPPAASSGIRYIPTWISGDSSGFNTPRDIENPTVAVITMNGPVLQVVNWARQYTLTITNPAGFGLQTPALGTYWVFEGDSIWGICQYSPTENICSGYTASGSLSSGTKPYFTATMSAPTTVEWTWRTRVAAPYFGTDSVMDLYADGGIAFAIAPNGNPSAAYRKSTREIVYAEWYGTYWQETVLARGIGGAEYIALGYDLTGSPIVAFQDSNLLDLVVIITSHNTAPAAGYQQTVIQYPGADGINCHIAVAKNGTIFVSAYAAPGKMLVYELTAGGMHVSTDLIDEEGNPGFYNGISVHPITNEPTAVYYDAIARKLYVADRLNGEWTRTVLDETGAVGSDICVATGKSGDMYVGYRDYTDTNANIVKMATRTLDGWHVNTVDKTGNFGRGMSISLATSEEYPHLLYYGTDSLRMARNVGKRWEIYTLLSGIDTSTGITAISNKTDGRALVAFYNGTSLKSMVLKEGAMIPDNVSGTGDDDGGQNYIPASGGGGCFIATAAFGAISSAEVNSLTAMRDGSLASSAFGSTLTSLYYAVSPEVADRETASIRALVRTLLD